MAGQRIKGQDTELVVIQNGKIVSAFTYIKSHEITLAIEMIEEGYLGRTTKDFDQIFNGAKGKFEMHYDSPDVFTAIQSIIDKATNRIPGTRFNIKTTLNFPSGRRARGTFANVAWGEIPLNFGSRQDYGSISMNYGCSEPQFIVI